MSTKKDAIKQSTSTLSKKKVATKPSSRREDSTDRSNVKKTETPQKARIKQATTTKTDKKIVGSDVKKKSDLKVEKPLKVQNTSQEKKVEKPLKVQSTSQEKKVSTSSTRKNIKQKVPVTPPSNRVSKTQYFPSKSLYSNALKVDESLNKNTPGNDSAREVTNREIRKNISSNLPTTKKGQGKDVHKSLRTKTKSEVLKVHNIDKKQTNIVSPETSSISERPRTATLRKGSIVNANIVGPDVPKQLVPKTKIQEVLEIKAPSQKSNEPDEYNYEDDFESYESDFEEYFSSSSANLDISGEEMSSISSSSSSANINLPDDFKSIQNRISSAGTDDERKMDSGHFDMAEIKHKQVLDNIKESIEKENANLQLHDIQRNNPASLSDEGFEDQKSLQFINFLDAKKKYDHRKSMENKRKRGEEILNMIRLDIYSFTLFDLPPVTYEVFMKNYGRHNTVQLGIQTGEDNIDEEIQTEEIATASMWTQIPICFSKIDEDDPRYWNVYKNDYLGVGGDTVSEDKVDNKSYNESNLNKFLLSAGNLILNIQAEARIENKGKIQKNTRDIPFSDGYIIFNTNKNIIKDCSVKCCTFSSDNNKILTVHSPKNKSEEYTNVVCIWTISNSEEPEAFFISYGHISCCSFGLDHSDFIYAGLRDGTISLWDLKKKIYNEDCLLKRIPIYTTEIGNGHVSKIVSLYTFRNYTDTTEYFQSNQTNEICSLDEDGEIIIWSVIMKYSCNRINGLNCTSWNDVVLVKNTKISLRSLYPELNDLQCTDFIVNTTESNYALVSTNYGFIIHHLIKGGRSNIRKFAPESPSVANCLEVCPFSPNYILAGFSDGKINLYSRVVENPIMVLSDKEQTSKETGVQIIQWSKSKPFVIYAKDINNTVHIWDLNESDMYPIYSVPFSQHITCMKLSPISTDENEKRSYMVVGTEDGELHLHILNSEHGPQPHQIYKEHVNTFLKYVNRL